MEGNIGTMVKEAPRVVDGQATLPERRVLCAGDSENVPMYRNTDRESAADKLESAGVAVTSYNGRYDLGVVEKFYDVTGF